MLSGTVILCDKVYSAANGQYVIAGTYSTWTAGVRDLRQAKHQFNAGLNLYVRFSPEHTGETEVRIQVKDEHRQVWDQSWLETRVRMQVPTQLPRMVELSITTPPFAVELHASEEAARGERVVLRNSIELSVDAQLVATTPFDVVFVKTVVRGA